ncbi:MAG: 3-dehydroquinate synthase [Verrucomicrobiales bacterium]
MIEVPVELSERRYVVRVSSGLLASSGVAVRAALPEVRSVAVVTDSTVGPLFGDTVEASLQAAGIAAVRVTVPAGEGSKSMACAEDVCRQMTRSGLDRGSGVIALGGGVVGDLAGFCAAIYFRGLPYVQIPTTVVSLVDSSVGGKTGVNTPEGKNLLGCFHQPSLVLADIETLSTLPAREYNEGFAEIIKHAAIRDAAMVPLIGRAHGDRSVLPELVARNVAIKASIVAADERETTGLRALLNFGHTIGHGIEASAGYGQLLHGEAISLGLLAALRLSEQVAGLDPSDSGKIAALLRRYDLPQRLPPSIQTSDVMEKLARDKKFKAGSIRFVLLRALGEAYVSADVTGEQIREAVEALR